MKVLLVIDHLGLGGAQRQIVELACGLARRRHTVALFNYSRNMISSCAASLNMALPFTVS